MCIGNFNKFLRREEQMVLNDHPCAQILQFNETVDLCGLADIAIGLNWTFEREIVAGQFESSSWTGSWNRMSGALCFLTLLFDIQQRCNLINGLTGLASLEALASVICRDDT